MSPATDLFPIWDVAVNRTPQTGLSVSKRHGISGTGLATPAATSKRKAGIASMLTTVFRRSAAAGLFALALVASSHSIAKADWTITDSCVGGWGMRNCVINQRDFPRDPHVRPVRGFESDQDAKESVARHHKWLTFCKPVVITDRYGVSRYTYAQPGCEFGRSE